MNKLLSTLLLTPVIALGVLPMQAQAQSRTSSIDALRNDLQTAVCLNNWDEALSIIGPMIGSSEITSDYRNQLIQYRRQIQTWRASQADLSAQPSCAPAIAEAEAAAEAEAIAREGAQQAAEAARRRAIASQPQAQQNNRSTAAQCMELATTVNWVVEQSQSLVAQTNFFDQSSLFGMLNQLSDVSQQASTSLQTLQLSDTQLQTFQQRLISTYRAYVPAINNLLGSARSGDMAAVQQQTLDFQEAATREVALMNEVNTYCGSNVINLDVNSPF
jgi:hypothetical protein